MTVLYGVYGTGGHGRETMPLLQAQVGSNAKLVFVDDHAGVASVNGCRVMTWAQFLAEPADRRAVTLAIGNGNAREKLHHQVIEGGVGFVNVQAANVVMLDNVDIAAGAILSPFTSFTSNIRIGLHFHANTHCSIAHDCRIGDFVTFGPGVRCNGNVVIKDHAYIGSGALIRQGSNAKPLTIGRSAIVGMGAVVTKDVPDGMTVVGNPARPMQKD